VPRIPVAAVAAGALALVASAVPALFGVAAVVLSSFGQPLGAAEWLLLLLPVGLSCWLLVGGVLLLAGRSWLAAALAAGLVTALVVWGRVQGSIGGDWHGFGLFSVAVPAATAVLASLPVVRRWVAARRTGRSSADRSPHPDGW
jgi:hypothetical protein